MTNNSTHISVHMVHKESKTKNTSDILWYLWWEKNQLSSCLWRDGVKIHWEGTWGNFVGVMVMFCIFDMWLYRCMYLSKLSKCTLKTLHFIVYNIYLKIIKLKKILTLRVCMMKYLGKNINVCSLLWNALKKKTRAIDGWTIKEA